MCHILKCDSLAERRGFCGQKERESMCKKELQLFQSNRSWALIWRELFVPWLDAKQLHIMKMEEILSNN